MVISPGFIDLHCHLREPGFEDQETIATGTQAAAKGGFTTVCCMPNTDPPIDRKATVEYIRNKAAAEGVVHVLPIGCISKGREGKELAQMGELAEAGVIAFSDDGNSVADSRLMRHAMEYSRLFDLPLIDHCEDTSLTEGGVMNEGWIATRLGLRGLPAAAEEIVLARDLFLAELTGARLHIAHVSTAGSVELLRRAKEKGVKVTAEVTPHHLTLTEERVLGLPAGNSGKNSPELLPLSPLSYDTNAKVNPPLRTRKDIEALLQGLKEGVIEAIATDHAPHTLVDKMCEFELAAWGISGLETALGTLLSLVDSGELDLLMLLSKLTWEPARILQGKGGKTALSFKQITPPGLGTLAPGAPGDVTILDLSREWMVDPDTFASKGKNTPWAGCRLKGKVVATVVEGKIVYQDESVKVRRGIRK
jgi:dihydroorotase